MSEEIYKKALDELLDISDFKPINKHNIMGIVTALMEKVDSFTELSGMEKKDVVITAIKNYINGNNIENDDELLEFTDNFLSSVIDMLVAVEKNEIHVKISKITKICRKTLGVILVIIKSCRKRS